MRRLAEEHNFRIVITNTSPSLTRQLEAGEFASDGQAVYFFPRLDQGVEWCENSMLSASETADAEASMSFIDQLAALVPEARNLDVFLEYLHRVEIEAGTYLMKKGDAPDSLYFIDQGQVTAQLEDDKVIRLETMGVGSVVGELGFYLKKQRTASVIADAPTVAYRLDLNDLERMEQEHPEVASAFHQIIVHLLSERVTHLINTVNALEN
jgi:SulP family sulfate permease